MIPPRLGWLQGICICTGLWAAGAAGAYEDAPQPNLAEILVPELKQSPHHSVVDVEVEGRFYRFRVDSDFGMYLIPSLALLRIRAHEIAILSQAVNEFSREDADLSEELHAQFSVSADNAIDILTRPVSTAGDLAGQLADNLNETLTGPSGADAGEREFNYDGAGSTDPVADMHRRNVAAQWGLDVYSSNPKVQEFLSAVARARSAGRIASGAPSFISPAQKHTSIEDAVIDGEVAGQLKNKNPEEVSSANTALLTQMQIGKETVDRFLRHPAYSPRHQTRIAHYLHALDGVVNRAAFLEAALDAQGESVALAFEQAALILADYHRHVRRVEKLYSGKDGLQAISEGNRILYVLPVDIVYWSERTERVFDGMLQRARQAGFSGWEVIVAGDLTEEARAGLRQREFLVREKFVK